MFEHYLNERPNYSEHYQGFINCHHIEPDRVDGFPHCTDLPYCNTDGDLDHGMDFRHVYGVQAMIMQSAEDADKVIAVFQSAVNQGYHPADVEQEVYRQAGVDPSNFTYLDKQRIQEAVNEMCGVY